MITYDEILERMKERFEELAGYSADDAGDIGIRLKVLAGEIYSMSSEADWLRKQMFPSTASGECLDLHAMQRGLARNKGTKASGVICFMLEMPLDYDFVIPQGTVCSVGDGSLRYVTLSAGLISRGGTIMLLRCEAENSGTQYNIGPDQVNTIVTYLSAGVRISNSTGFYGGTDDEDDESLRERIRESCLCSSNGVDAPYFEAAALETEGVASAKAFRGSVPGTVVVKLGGRGAQPSADTVTAAAAAISAKAPFGIDVQVSAASLVTVNVSVLIRVRSGYDTGEVSARVQQRIVGYFNTIPVGEDVTLAAMGRIALETDGVENYRFGSGMTDTAITASQMAVLGTLTVGDMDA